MTAEERGTDKRPYLIANAFRPTPSALPSPVPLPPDEWQLLTPNEQADNARFRKYLLQLIAREKKIIQYVSYQWPESFFKAEASGMPAAAITQINENLVFFYHDKAGEITKDFYSKERWFESWDGKGLPPEFIFRKGDVLKFGPGHTVIVAGDNTIDYVVVSHMSWNRSTQKSLINNQGYPEGYEHYGITRDKLVDLRNSNVPGYNKIFNNSFTVYRLRSRWNHLQLFNAELIPEGRGYVQHKIKKGDTLSRISDQYGASIDLLAKSNGIKNPDLIYAGDILLIP